MIYKNPVVKGFYPDPSVCYANGKYYMVCSSFQYFPGVPLFESDDLVNWTQKGYVLTRKSQIMLEKIGSSGGVFAATIRYNNGRFYVVTTNATTNQNFYVYTNDINGEWSEPIYVEQDGIDPSLYFEDGHAYFISNGIDKNNNGGVFQCEIDIESGKKITQSKLIWSGTGGRFLESPHLYKINNNYYLMAAEGGTEYGHMITYAKSSSLWGEFESYHSNPVLTNRNKAPYLIQGIGHGDLIQDKNGNWFILCLGFRQIDLWRPYHNLGREVFLIPVSFSDDGWFTAGVDGTADESYEISGDFIQKEKKEYTFENTNWKIDWCYMRHPDMNNYELLSDNAVLHGTNINLDDIDSPSFIAMRQKDFKFNLSCRIEIESGIGGLTCYMCEKEHYEIYLNKTENNIEAVLKLNIGGIKHIENKVIIPSNSAILNINADNFLYKFSVITSDGKEIYLGKGETKYLSSEVSEGFTGVMLGLFAVNGTSKFTDFVCRYF